METAGIIGGIGPESTMAYYRLIIAGYRNRVRDGSYPPVLVNSIDLKRILDLVAAERFAELSEYLLEGLDALCRAGARFGAIAANTPHLVLDDLRRHSSIPIVSIVEAACAAAAARGLDRVGLFGTSFTMKAAFYPDVFGPAGVALVLPSPGEQDYIHDKYVSELIPGLQLPETRVGLLAIARRLRDEAGIRGLILGGTELSPIFADAAPQGIELLDTTRIHVEAIVDRMLSGDPSPRRHGPLCQQGLPRGGDTA